MEEDSRPNGRVKLVLLDVDFVDSEDIFYIKFN